MQSASLRKLMLVGLLAPVAGCYSPYGYQSPYAPGPYGQPYQPQYPGNPVYTVPPGQPYAPGGTIQPGTGSPTPITPPSTYGSPGGGTSGGGQNDAPAFDPNTPPGGNSGGNRVVPDPADDINGPAAGRPSGLQPTSSQQESLQSPFHQESNNSGGPAQPAEVSTEVDPFEMPERVPRSAEIPNRLPDEIIQSVKYEAPSERLNPYGRDLKHANPRWLRGVLDFDAKQRTWQITYASKPDARDPNGGSLTLGDHVSLAGRRSGDIVVVDGAIDASQTDSRGKPLYLLDAVTPLEVE